LLQTPRTWWIKEMQEFSQVNNMKHFLVSGHTGDNLESLLKEMLKSVQNRIPSPVDPDVIKLGDEEPSSALGESWISPMKTRLVERFSGCF